MAFKPIQIGQSVFIDEGAGKYNPAPQILDEAALNEWPGREIGVFVSIGTGKRPGGTGAQQHEWWEGFIGGGIGEFAEARRRLVTKIEGCEITHQYMIDEHLSKRKVNRDNYYRLNVEVGVGEFGMNEWNRLADISTSSSRYLAKPEVRRINEDAAAKMARIERAKRRHQSYTTASEIDGYEKPGPHDIPPPLDPMAIELPGDDGPLRQAFRSPRLGPQYSVNAPRYPSIPDTQDKFTVIEPDQFSPPAAGDNLIGRSSDVSQPGNHPWLPESSNITPPRRSHESQRRTEAPPLPPKTPIAHYPGHYPTPPTTSPPRVGGGAPLPYPDSDGPPPVVNMARKPEFISR